MLAEAQQHNPSTKESDPSEQTALDESLSWIANANRQQRVGVHAPLAVSKKNPPSATSKSDSQSKLPVVIPQTAPGLQSPFSRAWAPILAEHDVRPEDFLQFMDHLNVCKTASPPFQVLSLAGMVLGFTYVRSFSCSHPPTLSALASLNRCFLLLGRRSLILIAYWFTYSPIPFAPLVGLGTSVAAGAGTYAVTRVRITRYLERANKEYFAPRGLIARIAKQKTLPQIVGQSENAPLLAALPRYGNGTDGSVTTLPSLRERRLQALGSHVARIEYCDLPAPQEESNMLDKLSGKMAARKAKKQEEKMVEDVLKNQEEEAKERGKLVKEERKIGHKMEKARAKGKRKDQVKLEEELVEAREEYEKKVGEGGEKELKAAKKFLFVVVQNAQAAAATVDS